MNWFEEVLKSAIKAANELNKMNMSKTIPFDIDKAKAGYKVVNGMGQEVEIIKWDMIRGGKADILVGITRNTDMHQNVDLYFENGVPINHSPQSSSSGYILRLIKPKVKYILKRHFDENEYYIVMEDGQILAQKIPSNCWGNYLIKALELQDEADL